VKAKALTALLAATAITALLLPGAALARVRPANRHPSPHPRSKVPPKVSEELTLKGTNGFEIGVTVSNRRRFLLSAHELGEAIVGASYSLRVHPSHDIVASLGKLGSVDVRFVPEKVRREEPPKGCRGGKTVIEQGHFVGTIAFHGEHGFTEVNARRAAGAVTRTPALRCPTPAPPPNFKKLLREVETRDHQQQVEEAEGEEEADSERLAVKISATARDGHVTLTASKTAFKEKHAAGIALTTVALFAHRQRGRVKEESAAAFPLAKGSTFLVPNRKKPASEGVLRPPAPFSGSATFRRHKAKPPTWTGDLRIDLPGFGPVRLAGPGTHASMCSGLACILRGLPSEESPLRRLP
jgi:hypothetical protein